MIPASPEQLGCTISRVPSENAAADDRTSTSGEDLQRVLDELEFERQKTRDRVLETNQKLKRIADDR